MKKMRMKLFKKDWTAAEADDWTFHDFLASLLGVLAYILVAVGIIGAFFLQVWGFVAVILALLLSIVMFFIIGLSSHSKVHLYARNHHILYNHNFTNQEIKK